jgi:hypothetical protein
MPLYCGPTPFVCSWMRVLTCANPQVSTRARPARSQGTNDICRTGAQLRHARLPQWKRPTQWIEAQQFRGSGYGPCRELICLRSAFERSGACWVEDNGQMNGKAEQVRLIGGAVRQKGLAYA